MIRTTLTPDMIRRIRHLSGLTQQDAADLVYVEGGGRSWRRWEKGDGEFEAPACTMHLFCLMHDIPYPINEDQLIRLELDNARRKKARSR